MTNDIETIDMMQNFQPVRDPNQICYLILHIGLEPISTFCGNDKPVDQYQSSREAAKKLGIFIQPIMLHHGISWEDRRYGFYFNNFERDDRKALHIVECFFSALSLIFGPILEDGELDLILRIPKEEIESDGSVHAHRLIEIEENTYYEDRIASFPTLALGHSSRIDQLCIDKAWGIVPVFFQNEPLERAAQYIKASQDDFYIPPGCISEILENPDQSAVSGLERIKLETALQNIFKSVEAVIGDPPKNNVKFFSRLREIGLDPDEPVGYDVKIPISQVIRKMNNARDLKSAHGSTPKSVITIKELMEFQECAVAIVWTAIEHNLGWNI